MRLDSIAFLDAFVAASTTLHNPQMNKEIIVILAASSLKSYVTLVLNQCKFKPMAQAQSLTTIKTQSDSESHNLDDANKYNDDMIEDKVLHGHVDGICLLSMKRTPR